MKYQKDDKEMTKSIFTMECLLLYLILLCKIICSWMKILNEIKYWERESFGIQAAILVYFVCLLILLQNSYAFLQFIMT